MRDVDEVWRVLEAALNEPELAEVRVSALLRDEMGDPDAVLLPLEGAPGRVMALMYDRAVDNLRLFAFDQAGTDWVSNRLDW